MQVKICCSWVYQVHSCNNTSCAVLIAKRPGLAEGEGLSTCRKRMNIGDLRETVASHLICIFRNQSHLLLNMHLWSLKYALASSVPAAQTLFWISPPKLSKGTNSYFKFMFDISFVPQPQFKSLIKNGWLNRQKSIAQTTDKANHFNLHPKRHFRDR